jgi:hypothetical protein
MKRQRKSNAVAKDLRTPKYRMRVVDSKKIYTRKEKYFPKSLEKS